MNPSPVASSPMTGNPPTGGRTFEVRNPATEDVIATVADCGVEDALKALDAAAAAADQWSLHQPSGPRDRAAPAHRRPGRTP